MIERTLFMRFCRLLMLFAVLAACAGKSLAPPPDAPLALRVPSDQMLALTLHGGGVQVYECRAAADGTAAGGTSTGGTSTGGATRYAWMPRGPEAELTDASGRTVGRLFAGPTWQAEDGSSVTGEIEAQQNASAPGALPWQLLRASSNAGKGLFAKVRYIQRLHTVGGTTPSTGCDASQARKPVRVPYSSDYYFYTARH